MVINYEEIRVKKYVLHVTVVDDIGLLISSIGVVVTSEFSY